MATRKRKVSVSSSPFSEINTGSSSFLVIFSMSAIVVAVSVIVWHFNALNGGQTDFSLSDNFYQEIQDNVKTAFSFNEDTTFTSGSFSSCIKEPDLYDNFAYNTLGKSVYSNVMLAADKWNTNATRYSSVNVIDKSLVLNSARRDSKSWSQSAVIMKKVTSGSFKLSVDLQSFETRKDFALLQVQLWPANQQNVTYFVDLQQFPQKNISSRSIALARWDSQTGGIAFDKNGVGISDRNKIAISGQNRPAQLTFEYNQNNGELVASYKETNGDQKVIGKIILDKKTNFGISFTNVLTHGATHEIGHEAVLKNIKYVGCFAN